MKTKTIEKVYSYKENALNFNVDAQVAGKAIEEIQEKNGGQCTPDDVISLAKNENHPLHPVFDWDDASAARKQRLQMARQLIGAITVTIREHEVTRSFVSVKVSSPTDEKEKRAYVSLEEAKKPDYEIQLREEASNWLKVFISRYQVYNYLSIEVAEVKQIVSRMEEYIENMKVNTKV